MTKEKKPENEIESKRVQEERELPNCDLWEGGLIVEHPLISFKMCLFEFSLSKCINKKYP